MCGLSNVFSNNLSKCLSEKASAISLIALV